MTLRQGDLSSPPDPAVMSNRHRNRRKKEERRRQQPVPQDESLSNLIATEDELEAPTSPLMTAEESPSESMHEKLNELESIVDQKDELIVALTNQLEQAAEQLDRLHRTGADRGVRLAAGIPAELIETQKTLADELQNSLRLWDEAQAASTLGRIEMRLDELRSLVVQSLEQPPPIKASLSHGAQVSSEQSAEAREISAKKAGNDNAKSKSSGKRPSPGDSYESLKARLLDEPELETVLEEPDTGFAEASEASEPLELPPAPNALNLEKATDAELRAAVEERDLFIQALLQRLRTARPFMPIDWDALNEAPEELAKELRRLQTELQDSLKISEVELSLERAKLSRIELRLGNWEKQLEHREKNLGGSGDATQPVGNAAEKKKNARWLRMFGKDTDE